MKRLDTLLGAFSDEKRLVQIFFDPVNIDGTIHIIMSKSGVTSGIHFHYKHEIREFIEVLNKLKDELPEEDYEDEL
jgi:hypothetical protein